MAPIKKKNQRLWNQQIRIARNFNKSNDDSISRKLVEEISVMRKNESQMSSMFSDPNKNTWSPKDTQLPLYRRSSRDRVIDDLEAICLHMAIPTSSQYDNSPNNYISKRRATVPSTGTATTDAKISSLRAAEKRKLEQIPEVLVTQSSSSSNEEQNKSSDSDQSTSNKTHTIIVTPSDINTEPA